MFEQAFKNIDNVVWKEAGCTTEQDKATVATLENRKHRPIIEGEFRWEKWAVPKTSDGKLTIMPR